MWEYGYRSAAALQVCLLSCPHVDMQTLSEAHGLEGLAGKLKIDPHHVAKGGWHDHQINSPREGLRKTHKHDVTNLTLRGDIMLPSSGTVPTWKCRSLWRPTSSDGRGNHKPGLRRVKAQSSAGKPFTDDEMAALAEGAREASTWSVGQVQTLKGGKYPALANRSAKVTLNKRTAS